MYQSLKVIEILRKCGGGSGSRPEFTVLSTIAHGQGDLETAIAIALGRGQALSPLPDQQRQLYSAVIEDALSDAARKALEMLPQTQKFLSESQRRSYERGVAEGEARGEARGLAEGQARGLAEGEARALLQILAQRGLAITPSSSGESPSARIGACSTAGCTRARRILSRGAARLTGSSNVAEPGG